MLTVGSLFSGIGGIELGLEATGGFRTLWQVEIDPYCRRILEKHWPEIPKYGDITTLSCDDLERPDLLAGGFPCQDLSTAGLRAGLSGSRSGLWREFLRLIRGLIPICVRSCDIKVRNARLNVAGPNANWY
jgi:DNA (cytosine-5)-methyltransferase 1